jgi:hypothetical protein
MAAENLRELGRLPVPDGARDSLDRERAREQELGRPAHARSLELAAEGGAAHLGERIGRCDPA